MRTYDRCFPYLIEYILEPLDPDIFIHTWRDRGGTWKEGLDQTADTATITRDLLEEQYDPTDVVIEEFNEEYYDELDNVNMPEEVKSLPGYAKSILPLFYKIHESVRLKKEHERNQGEMYDLVILLRPDIVIGDPLPNKILQAPENLWTRPTNSYYHDEQFIVSSTSNIDYYCLIWENLQEYLQTGLGSRYGEHGKPAVDHDHHMHIGNPERLVHYHLEQSQIEVRPFQIRSQILRFDDEQPFFEKPLPERLWKIIADGGIDGSRGYPYGNLEAAIWVLRNQGLTSFLQKSTKRIKHYINHE
jgi:hypothetical protein